MIRRHIKKPLKQLSNTIGSNVIYADMSNPETPFFWQAEEIISMDDLNDAINRLKQTATVFFHYNKSPSKKLFIGWESTT